MMPAARGAGLLTEHINKIASLLECYLEASRDQPGAATEAEADAAAG